MSTIGFRAAATTTYQALFAAELTAVIGAAPHVRAPRSEGGSRPCALTTTAGDREPRIPKLRAGPFFPSLLERRRRIDQPVRGGGQGQSARVSTRKVDDLVRAGTGD